MTAGQLIDILKECDPNKIVILQKDGEGNGFSPCDGVDSESVYEANNTWSGDVYPFDSVESTDTGWVSCVILYPVN